MQARGKGDPFQSRTAGKGPPADFRHPFGDADGLYPRTARKGNALDFRHPFGNNDGFYPRAKRERIPAPFLRLSGENEFRQFFAADVQFPTVLHPGRALCFQPAGKARNVYFQTLRRLVKDLISERLQRFGQNHFLQVFTARKRAVPDRSHPFGNGYGMEADAAPKSICADRSHPRGQDEIARLFAVQIQPPALRKPPRALCAQPGGKIGDMYFKFLRAVAEAVRADKLQARGQFRAPQSGTIRKRQIADRTQSVREVHFRKRLTLPERLVPDLFHPVGKDDLFQIGDPVKRPRPHLCHVCGQDEFFAERLAADVQFRDAAERSRPEYIIVDFQRAPRIQIVYIDVFSLSSLVRGKGVLPHRRHVFAEHDRLDLRATVKGLGGDFRYSVPRLYPRQRRAVGKSARSQRGQAVGKADGSEFQTPLKRPESDALQPFGQRRRLQFFTARKGQIADRFYPRGQIYALQLFTSRKGRPSDLRHGRTRHAHTLYRRAIIKRVFADTFRALGEIEFAERLAADIQRESLFKQRIPPGKSLLYLQFQPHLQGVFAAQIHVPLRRTAAKRAFADLFQSAAQDDLRQIFTPVKRIFADLPHAVADNDLPQGFAVVKRIAPYLRHAVPDRDLPQGAAFKKHTPLDLCHAGGKIYALQRFASRKGRSPDLFHTFGNVDAPQRFTVREPRLADFFQAVR